MGSVPESVAVDATQWPAGAGLKWLIAPNEPDAFLADIWERQPLAVHRNSPGYYGMLLSLEDIDHVLTANLLRVEDVQLTNAARDISPSDYSHPSGVVDAARLYQAFADGGTIILPQLHYRLSRLAALCRTLERELSTRFQTNIYLTPGGAQGFRRHYDSHDVFILQIAGRKHWRLYDTPVALPLRSQTFRPDEVEAAPETAAFTLEPGDAAYIPRGTMHDAESDDAMSLHVTVGVLGRTWHDLLVEALSAVSLEERAFRRNLPAGFARADYDRTAARATFADMLRHLADRMDFDAALDRFVDDFVTTRHPLLDGQLAQIARLSGLTVSATVVPRPDLVYRLEQGPDALSIHCYGTTVTLPAHAAPAALAALQPGGTVISALPGELDDDSKLVLVRRLIREGLVTTHD